uniref:Uncharacterized protein n=1 Tax=Oryza punctata TaxID=4537 RepID=A0A0E0MKH1_ORYPU
MASRILPSFFRRRRSDATAAGIVVPATREQMLELEMRLWDVAPAAAYELQKRRHWTPEQVAREAEKQRWVAERKRLIAKESKWHRQRPRSNSGNAATAAVLDLDKELGEEFERKRFYEELRLQQAEARRAAAVDSSKVDHPAVVVTEEEEDDDVPARGGEGYLERRRNLLGRYRLT